MHTTLPEFLERKPLTPVKPTPPTRAMIEALHRPTGAISSSPPLDDNGVPMEEEPMRLKEVTSTAVPKVVEPNPFFRFRFKRPWFGTYTTKDYKFVLRVEHFPELMRLVNEFNKTRPEDEFPISVSDIVSAALDFVLDHPVVLTGLKRPEEIREVIATTVYRKAYWPLRQLHELF